MLRIESPHAIACRLRTQKGEWRTCRLLPGTAVMGPLVLVRLQPEFEAKPLNLVLLPDSAEREALRLLRVWLRCYRPAAETKGVDENAP